MRYVFDYIAMVAGALNLAAAAISLTTTVLNRRSSQHEPGNSNRTESTS